MPNRFLSLKDLADLPPPEWLIDGLFEVGSLVMLAGPPGSYKSFLTLDWVLSMASARQWHGRHTRPARVAYLLGEGKASLLKRVEAWARYYQIDRRERSLLQENFRVTFEVPQFASNSSTDRVLADLADDDFEPNVVVVDTFARSFVGLDENSQKDTGLWIENADRLRQLGCTVIFIHHTAKNTEFGLKYRGSSAILAGMDTAFTLAKDTDDYTVSKFACIKQKDHDEGDPLYFKRLIVRDNATDPGSIVLLPATKASKAPADAAKEKEIDALLASLMVDPEHDTDRSRARVLSQKLGVTEAAAQTRISRERKKRATEIT